MNGSDELRTNYLKIWGILRSIDKADVTFFDPARAEEWKAYRWAEFRTIPMRTSSDAKT